MSSPETDSTWTTLRSEASFASRCFGVTVESVEIITEGGEEPYIVPAVPDAVYYDDRSHNNSVRTASAGLPGRGRR
jgi:hypothetical protein